jgi:SAM-dependent methyltransferase
MSRLRAAIADRLPAGLRRAAAGFLLDLQSLPARLRDPERRGDPWQTLHNVGAGDFRAVGDDLLRVLIDHAGLARDERVLDIGCGAGRVARPLADFLSARGSYVGFDVSHAAIAGCARRFAGRPNLHFVHADVRNPEYNPRGHVDEAAYAFPCADRSIDLAFATSVFTHMRLAPIRHYLREAARVLAPDGRFAFTAYLIDEPTRAQIAAGDAGMAFVPWQDASWTTDPGHPERAIAHDARALAEAVAAAGLVPVGPPLRGAWRPPATYHGWQDLWLVRGRGQ